MITAAEAQSIVAARELAARVIRVDDFAQDLGASLLQPVEPGDASTTLRRWRRTCVQTPRRRAVA